MDTLMDLANYSLMTVLELQLKNEELELQKKAAQTSVSCVNAGPYNVKEARPFMTSTKNDDTK